MNEKFQLEFSELILSAVANGLMPHINASAWYLSVLTNYLINSGVIERDSLIAEMNNALPRIKEVLEHQEKQNQFSAVEKFFDTMILDIQGNNSQPTG